MKQIIFVSLESFVLLLAQMILIPLVGQLESNVTSFFVRDTTIVVSNIRFLYVYF